MQLVYMQLGSSGLKQFRIAAKSVRIVEPEAEIVLYTDQPPAAIGVEGIEVRPWTLDQIPDESRANTPEFGRVTLEKMRVMRDALVRSSSYIVYSDVDIIACRPFRKRCEQAAALRSVHVSTEGDDRIPEVVCTGFLILRNDAVALDFLRSWEEHTAAVIARDPTRNDEDALNDLLAASDDWRPHVERLSSNFAAPGWFYSALVPLNNLRLTPLFFHSNWTHGHRVKEGQMAAAFHIFHSRPHRPLARLAFRSMRFVLRAYGRALGTIR